MDASQYTPPDFVYDLLAEQALLKIGLHGDGLALQLCGELINTFWYAKHQQLAAVLSGMYLNGQRVDLVSVLGQLSARGLTGKLDGPYLHTVYTGPGDHSGVRWYGDRLRKLAARRTLREAALRVTQHLDYAWGTGDDDTEGVAIAEFREALTAVEAASRAEGLPVPLSMSEFLDGSMEFDWIVPGLLERGERLVITGSEGTGKALKTDTPVPTVGGWSTMGDLRVGEEVFAPDGSVARVVAATEVLYDRPCYRVTFSDGATIVADANHQWLTETLKSRETTAKQLRRSETKPRGTDQRNLIRYRPTVVTTEGIAATLMARDGHTVNHSVVCCAPLDPPSARLPIDPYLLGVFLGDGATNDGLLTLNRDDAPAIELNIGVSSHRVPSAEKPGCVGVRVPGFRSQLRESGFLGYKHIPTLYLRASAEQRWALLAGLLDTDRHLVVSSGSGRGTGAALCELTLCDKQLAADSIELLLSLGIKASIRESDATLNGRVIGRRWRMQFQTSRNPFRVPRKAQRWQPLRTRRATLRYIIAVEPVESVPVRCIQVDRPDGMFVVGRECIPTHNSVLTSQLCTAMAGGVHPFTGAVLGRGDRGIRVTIVDCENSAVQSRRRFKRIISQVDRLRVDAGYDPADWKQQIAIDIRPEGIDLLKTGDVTWLEHAITSTAPDLLVLGPLYKTFNADPSDETSARAVVAVLDGLRARHGFALLTEAHAGKSEDGSGNRRMAPIGSSLWMRWPEYGFGIRRAKDAVEKRTELVDVVAWRGSREERQWPERLRHGHRLPWEPPPDRPRPVDDEDRAQGWYQ